MNAILSEVEALTEEQAEQLTEEDMAWLLGAAVKMELFAFVENLGDFNADGKKNANDALIALRAAVGKTQLTEEQILRADVTGDDAVNAKDALEILKYSGGKAKNFPEGDFTSVTVRFSYYPWPTEYYPGFFEDHLVDMTDKEFCEKYNFNLDVSPTNQ